MIVYGDGEIDDVDNDDNDSGDDDDVDDDDGGGDVPRRQPIPQMDIQQHFQNELSFNRCRSPGLPLIIPLPVCDDDDDVDDDDDDDDNNDGVSRERLKSLKRKQTIDDEDLEMKTRK